MKKKRLTTAAAIPGLEPGVWVCPNVAGLNLHVGERRKTWMLRYKDGDQTKRINLGFYPAVTLSDARDKARKEKERIQNGLVPSDSAIHPSSSKQLTMAELIDQYEAFRRKKKEKIKSIDHALKMVRNNLGKHLDRPVAHFTMRDAMTLRDEIAARTKTGAMSNRFLSYLKPIIRWGVSEKGVTANVVRDIIKVGAERKGTRWLREHEIVALWGATATAHTYHRLLRFMLLTGCRLSEGSELRYGDIINGVWHQTYNKNDNPVRHKLARAALDTVGTGDENEWVFPSRVTGRPMQGFSSMQKKVIAEMKKRASKPLLDDQWNLLDLRRTTATHLQMLGIPPHIIDMCQAHKIQGIRAHYQTAEMLDEKHDAWEKWADKINSLVDTGEIRGQPVDAGASAV